MLEDTNSLDGAQLTLFAVMFMVLLTLYLLLERCISNNDSFLLKCISFTIQLQCQQSKYNVQIHGHTPKDFC